MWPQGKKRGRPAKPMTPVPIATPAVEECREGALSLDDAASFLAIGKTELRAAIVRGELLPVYHGRKPRILKQHLIDRLAAELEAARERDQTTRQPAPGGPAFEAYSGVRVEE